MFIIRTHWTVCWRTWPMSLVCKSQKVTFEWWDGGGNSHSPLSLLETLGKNPLLRQSAPSTTSCQTMEKPQKGSKVPMKKLMRASWRRSTERKSSFMRRKMAQRNQSKEMSTERGAETAFFLGGGSWDWRHLWPVCGQSDSRQSFWEMPRPPTAFSFVDVPTLEFGDWWVMSSLPGRILPGSGRLLANLKKKRWKREIGKGNGEREREREKWSAEWAKYRWRSKAVWRAFWAQNRAAPGHWGCTGSTGSSASCTGAGCLCTRGIT